MIGTFDTDDPIIEIAGIFAEETTTRPETWPQACKKLQNWTFIVYECIGAKKYDGITVGVVIE